MTAGGNKGSSVKELKLNYYSKEAQLFVIRPYYGNSTKVP